MIITLEARSPCPVCGCQLASYAFPDVRVNKRSIRARRGGYLWVGPDDCPECGFTARRAAQSYPATRWLPDAGSLADIAAYRARRWPEMAAA